MAGLFSLATRDKAIETTCSNLVMAGLLLPSEVTTYMSTLHSYNDSQLAEALIESRLLLDNYYELNARQRVS